MCLFECKYKCQGNKGWAVLVFLNFNVFIIYFIYCIYFKMSNFWHWLLASKIGVDIKDV